MPTPNTRLRARREQCGHSQAELAELTELSRQSINAIEAGRTLPSVDVALRLCRVLGCSVEQLFGSDAPELLRVEARTTPGARVALARIRDRWVARSLGDQGMRLSADGLVEEVHPGEALVRPLRPPEQVDDNLVIEGCAPGLGLLADRLNAHPGAGRFLWFSASSGQALAALARGHAHVAGVHLVDARTREPNLPAVRRLPMRTVLAVLTFARWEVGLLTRNEDAGRIRSVADLAASRVRLVTREPDAGAQQLLERELRAAGVHRRAARKGPEAKSHLDVARAIAMNAADAGVASRDAAIACDLRFVPIAEERFDLVLPRTLLGDARVVRLFETLVSAPVRAELAAVGYDVAEAGNHVADVRAA